MRSTSLRELTRATQRALRCSSALAELAHAIERPLPALDAARQAFEPWRAKLTEEVGPDQLDRWRTELPQALQALRAAGLELAEQLAGHSSPSTARWRVDCFRLTQELRSIQLRLQAVGPLRLLRLLDPQLTHASAIQVLWFYLRRPRHAWEAINELIYCSPLWVWFVGLATAFLLAHGAYYLLTHHRQAALFSLLQFNRQQSEQAPASTPEQLAAKLATHGLLLLQQKRPADAYLLAQEALALKYDYVPARCLTAMALVELGRATEGIAAYRALLKDNPADATALNNLADLLATHPDPRLRNGSEALHLATVACSLSGRRNPTHLATLAEAQAELGRFDQAIITANLAMVLAREQGNQELVQIIQNRLQWFESGLAVRQPTR